MTRNRVFMISSVLLLGFMMIFAGCKKDEELPEELPTAWTRKADFSGSANNASFTFSLNNKGYIGGGIKTDPFENLKELWEYDSNSNSWTQKSDLPIASSYGVSCSINNIGYLVNDESGIFEYNPISNEWTNKNPLNYVSGFYRVGITTDSKFYYGNTKDKKFTEYDPLTNSCKEVASFIGEKRYSVFSFSINNKGYVGGGRTDKNDFFNEMYEYNPSADVWTQIDDSIPFTDYMCSGFSIKECGYVIVKGVIHEFNSLSNTWIIKGNSPINHDESVFVIGNRAYLKDYTNDFYMYEP